MDIDFHYYATFAAARLAGHDYQAATVIAYAAQYVDDSTLARLQDGNGAFYIGDFRPVPTVQSNWPDLADYEADPLRWGGSFLNNLRQVWSVFHFLPGNYGPTPDQKIYRGPQSTLTWSFGQLERDEFNMLCLPNSSLAGKMVNDIRNHLDQDYALPLIGLRMHVLADTWAHMYYTGAPAWCINDAGEKVYSIGPDGQETEVVWKRLYYKDWTQTTVEVVNDLIRGEEATPPSPFVNSVFYLGHGRMGHLPDYPWITYRYQPLWSDQWVVKNNPECYVKAFRQLVWAMRCLRSNTEFNPLDPAQEDVLDPRQEAVLREILLMKGDEAGRESAERRCQMWERRLGDLGVDAAPPKYDADAWLNEFRHSANKQLTAYYCFNRSARLQLELVAATVKEDLNVVLDNTQGCTTIPVELQASTGSYVGAMVEAPCPPSTQYFPRLGSAGVTLEFILDPGQGDLVSGSRVRIRSTEPATGKYCFLGAWATPALYYYTQDYDTEKQGWIVTKAGGVPGEKIVPGDRILIENVHYSRQNMVWYDDGDGYRYLTTREGQPTEAFWTVCLPGSGRDQPTLAFGSGLTLQADSGAYLGPMRECAYALTTQYYPRLMEQAVALVFENGAGANDGSRVIRSGDTFSIRTTEGATANYNYLGAWDTPALYYYKKDYDPSRQGWIVEKVRGAPGPELHAGDVVRLRNQHYGDKPYLAHYQDGGETWLTTRGGANATVEWIVRRA